MRGVFLIIPLLIVIPVKSKVAFEDCGSTGSGVSFNCDGCDDKDLLELKKGSQEKFTLTFTPGKDSKTLTNNVIGILGGGMEMPYNSIMSPDFCTGLTSGSCPVKSGTEVVFTSNIEVLPSYPTIPVTIKWEVKDDSGSTAVCIKIKSKIVA